MLKMLEQRADIVAHPEQLEERIEALKQKFSNPNAVNKSWPQLWKYLTVVPKLAA